MTETSTPLKPVLNFLYQHEPFMRMLPAHQEYLAMHLEQVFYARGEAVMVPEEGVVNSLYIVKHGCIIEQVADQASSQSYMKGDCFPVCCLMQKQAVPFTLSAQKTTICFRLREADFEYLMQQSSAFHVFYANNPGKTAVNMTDPEKGSGNT